ncbi:DUF5129 domain-containing protein [Citricoccus sp. NR2]|uniref:DUF5129 domain-containing protein n=1 Tax=Citricoccus sp. NR2 TaxID=3004095 RepID=UPI0022DD4FB2|nr:DUF5129 domain-containing protein [Citricoccus sp. NR2]WBL20521.1 DUF5129 domain-containing protein [Citricoccus sp. NR2]
MTSDPHSAPVEASPASTSIRSNKAAPLSYRKAMIAGVLAAGIGIGGVWMAAAAPSLFGGDGGGELQVESIQDASDSGTIDTQSPGVSYVDTAGVLHEPTVAEGLSDVNFYEPTRLVLFTERGAASDNFNERVLAYMRANHPELISDDGQKWADGVVIIGIDPEGRHIGSYFGEDRKVSMDMQEDIQESGFDAAREARWSDAMVDASERASELVNRPTLAAPGLWVAAGGAGTLVLGGAAGVFGARTHRRRKTRDLIVSAQEHYAQVTMDMEATELSASTIPEDTPYGARILERFRVFHDDYLKLHDEIDALSELTPEQLGEAGVRQRAKDADETASLLNMMDDVIVDTNTFLNRQSGWERAWMRQTEPVREDLNALSEYTDSKLFDSSALKSQAVTLGEFQRTAQAELEEISGGVTEETISPTEALDRLDDIQSRLSEQLKTYYDVAAADFTKTSSERSDMDQEMEKAQSQRRRRLTILDSSYSGGVNPYWTAIAFSHGYTSGTSSVESSRSSSSSGSSSGYGAGGGSFSGAGSSSRF